MQKNPSVSFKQSLEDIDKDEGDRLQASMSTKTKHKSLFTELAIFSSMSSLPPQSQIAQTSRPTLSVYTTSNGQSQKGQGWFSRMSGFHSLSRTNSLSGNNSRESTLSRSIPTVAMSPINLISAETPKWYVLTEKELEDYIDAQDDNNVCLAKPGIALDVSTMTKQEVRRQEVIYELIQTERDYVKDMKLLIDLFLRQFRQKHILSQREVTKIFSNVEQLTSVNKELLRSLEKRRIEEKCAINKVGDIFLVVAQFFRMYNIYCANYPEAQAFLLSQADNVDLKLFLQYCYLKPECRSLDLDSYLLKPVQRICKYPLLLKEILKYTDTTHPDHADLTAACNLISKVVDTVNESRRFVENQQKLLSAFSKLDFDVRLFLGATYYLHSTTNLFHSSANDTSH
ncbi:Dbl homology domain-containing protein [Paraphysoderma sedebokerense]|nr:Dbl homology domain-containing protein [Paraphysoderma sedebokerense]